MECPFVKRDSIPDLPFNEPKDYRRMDGEGGNYRYYMHSDGFELSYPCQFCQLIGRKRDIFECFNEKEWRACFHYQWESKRRDALRQQKEEHHESR